MRTETRSLSTQPPAPAPFPPLPSLRRTALACAAAALLGLLLLVNNAAADTFLWRATRWAMGSQDGYVWADYKLAPPSPAVQPDAPWYRRLEPPLHGKLYKRTEKVWRVLRDLGEPTVTLLLLATVWVYAGAGAASAGDRRRDLRARIRAVAILAAATVSAGGLAALIRMTLGRLRPNGQLPGGALNEGSNLWTLFRGFHTGSDLSFPSGHATLAFATAAALAYLSPRGRRLFLAIAAGCALARVVMQAHFYSDILIGGALGYLIGTLVARGADRLFPPALPPLPPTAAAR